MVKKALYLAGGGARGVRGACRARPRDGLPVHQVRDAVRRS